ncbi:MAG: hypothetical protein EDM78_11400 [Proteobacteria bacterium]|nr:MAG: hypothetical protein EDM78_11400 [Pseudomonadota bacterium]
MWHRTYCTLSVPAAGDHDLGTKRRAFHQILAQPFDELLQTLEFDQATYIKDAALGVRTPQRSDGREQLHVGGERKPVDSTSRETQTLYISLSTRTIYGDPLRAREDDLSNTSANYAPFALGLPRQVRVNNHRLPVHGFVDRRHQRSQPEFVRMDHIRIDSLEGTINATRDVQLIGFDIAVRMPAPPLN